MKSIFAKAPGTVLLFLRFVVSSFGEVKTH